MDSNAIWDIPDLTSLNARKQLDSLLDELPQDSPLTTTFRHSISHNALLPTLSQFMLHPSLTMAITWAFRPLLMDLCARWLDTDEDYLEKLEALGLLIEIHEEIFPILSTFLRLHERGPLYIFLKGKQVDQVDRAHLQRVLLAYYRILHATPTLPQKLNWDLKSLLKLCASSQLDRGARWLAIRCYAMQANVNESSRIRMEQDALGEICSEDCPVNYGEDISGIVREIDGWLLPVLETNRIQDYRNRILESPDYFSGGESADIRLMSDDLSPRTANVHGILLLRAPQTKPVASSLVLTTPALLTLRQLAVNVSLHRPTLLSSAPSSGKTAFLNHLAAVFYPSSPNQVITIHLADTSLDPRSLIGSYVSSSTSAGSFEWKDGVLVKAMREGRWVVFEDINRASDEILGLITPLAESMDDIKPIGSNASLSLGNRGSVEAAESFALFATRSVEEGDASSLPLSSFLGAQKWEEVFVPANSLDDLRLIVDSKFPKIAGPISDCLIDIWLSVKRLRVLSATRPVGIRDLEKFCSRVSHLLESSRSIPTTQHQRDGPSPSIPTLLPHPALREEIYLDARDIFFAAGASNKPALEQRAAIAAVVGEKLALSEEIQDWLLKQRTPTFEVEKDVDGRPVAIKAGRIMLAVEPVIDPTGPAPTRSFSMHKQALRLVSQLAASVRAFEPVLLTGETGTGKTSVTSHLASLLNKPLVSLNLSNQTETSDLIGGFRPVSARVPALELQHRFTELFKKTFSSKKNEKLLQGLEKAVSHGKWKAAVKLWTETTRTAVSKLKENETDIDVLRPNEIVDPMDSPMPRKRRKVQIERSRSSESEWTIFDRDVRHFEVQHVLDKGKFSFHFVEGPLVKAIRSGAWVLLDEINLASPETLECIAGLLQGPNASITLTEQGSLEPIPRHPEFRLFACMNPATDVGKKDLPGNIRARFTEIEVPPPDEDPEALMTVITHYIGHLAVSDKAVISDIAELYTNVKYLAASGKIADGSNHTPHYSMRSLSRMLTFASDAVHTFGMRRALWEGFTMAFTMVLDQGSADVVLDLARRTLLSSVKNKAHFLSVQPAPPQNGSADSLVQLGPFWLSSGPNELEEVSDYILTPSVQMKLVHLARIIMTERYPILIEGPTSSGKTSAIEYLARRTGHNFVRINNHEHTDIQEYLGSYASDPKTGKLVLRDGLLVRALRRGDWIVLDELNLAPTDVLEALNRLLDDNRELVIPETQEIVKPHPHFMLFATQNPSGVYAGRKVLSRALRNRFLEVHFEDVPPVELEYILCQRSRIAPSYSQRIVAVFHELQKRRQIGRIFEGKEGFATLRDLFRWAGRDAQGYQELAENGYMLLAERTRRVEDKLVVKDVLEKVMNVIISEDDLYDVEKLGSVFGLRCGIIWTKPMRRLFLLLSRALKYDEPVLLVGETGSGKTSVCQVYAEVEGEILRSVNCHQNTEAADIIGGLRPVRQSALVKRATIGEVAEILGIDATVESMDKAEVLSLIASRLDQELSPQERQTIAAAQRIISRHAGFLEWQDGPLVASMRSGNVFLLDEISLADDSVLERLNSVLEPSRTLVLAEKGGKTLEEFLVTAKTGFKFVATMNPGGDFGKKELSPALRNRFTEIWVPSLMNRDDLAEIVSQSWEHDHLAQFTEPLLDFVDWISSTVKDNSLLSLRDILSWIKFCNVLSGSTGLIPRQLFYHGGDMTILDGLFSLTQLSSWSSESLKTLRVQARHRLQELIAEPEIIDRAPAYDMLIESDQVRIGPFSVPVGTQLPQLRTFSFRAPTSLENAFRLIRACQITKPILLEGSPGVGKTSLVSALAATAGQRLIRINLSEQTDLVDLFGSDLPVEETSSGSFGWNDAEFLRALKNGYWVLLDEMNLASQAVLEGLNAVFDHRGTVYIPELDRSFSRHPNFRVFAAQNPLNQGSGRKGLPKSFLNRFTKVFVEELLPEDLLIICRHLFPTIEPSTLQRMIAFNWRLQEEVVVKRRFGSLGVPWEFNLRDIMRWASLIVRSDDTNQEPWKFLNVVYGSRFRTDSDRTALLDLFGDVFEDADIQRKLHLRLIDSPSHVSVGSALLQKGPSSSSIRGPSPLPSQYRMMESAFSSMGMNWLVIVTGARSSGKTSFVRALASASGQRLREMALGSSSDTSDLIGSYEQVNGDFHAQHLLATLLHLLNAQLAHPSLVDPHSLESLLSLRERATAVRESQSLSSLQKIVQECLEASSLPHLKDGLRTSLEAVLELSTKVTNSGPRFEWIDGPLVQAMRQGQWLLLDNANLCSPSILDRLNSLCELNGSIVLTEKSVDQEIVRPHPDFRLIMTVDPYRGEISRAMRNRGIEISLEPLVTRDDLPLLLDAKRLPIRTTSSPSTAFELSRRGFGRSSMRENGGEELYISHRRNFGDTLSSRIMEINVLYNQCNPSCNTALALFIFGYSSTFCLRGLLRLLKSFKTPRAVSILEPVQMSLESSDVLRHLLANGASLRDDVQHGCLHPFISSQYVDWLSDDEQEACTTVSLMLELCLLASNMDLELHRQAGIDENSLHEHLGNSSQTPILQKHENLVRFVEIIPNLVRTTLFERRLGDEHMSVLLELLQYADYLYRASNQITADFSTLHVVSGWILRCVMALPYLTEGFEEKTRVLHEAYALSSGQKLCVIWSSALRLDVSTRVHYILEHLGLLPLVVQQRIIAIVSLACATPQLNAEINENLQKTEDELVKILVGKDVDEESLLQPAQKESILAMLLIEMNDLACFGPAANMLNLKETSRVLQQSGNLADHASRIIAYQQLLWKADTELGHIPELVSVHLEWHKAVWACNGLSQGPSMAFTPTLLRSGIEASSIIFGGALKDIRLRESLLSDNISSSLRELLQSQSRECLVIGFLLRSVELVLRLCSLDFNVDFVREVVGVGDYRTAISRLDEKLKNADYEVFDPLRLALNAVAQSASWAQRVYEMGKCWVLLSQTLLALYVPNIPIDPLRILHSRRSFIQAQEAWIHSQIRVFTCWERLSSGHHGNIITRLLQDRLSNLAETTDVESPKYGIDRESDFPLLQAFWNETRNFLTEILHPDRLQLFVLAAGERNENVISQEVLLQDSISNFLQRMENTYKPLQDLMPAIELAMMHLRFGLKALTHSNVLRSPASFSHQIRGIVAFPSVEAKITASAIKSQYLTLGEFSSGDALLLQLTSLLHCPSSEAKFSKIQSLYEQIASLWSTELAGKAEDARQTESIYRRKQTRYEAVDDDIEDEQVLQLFPRFDAEEGEAEFSTVSTGPMKVESSLTSSSFSQRLLSIHLRLFGALTLSLRGEPGALWRELRHQMVSSWLDGPLISLPSNIDDDSLAFRLDLLRDAKSRFQHAEEVDAYSFYRDPDLREARKTTNVVNELQDTLRTLIRTWPDQLVLQHLRDRCDSVLSMNMNSSVAKILGAIERLLLHTEDWESFANRDNSLSTHRQALTDLIVDWRKRELAGWKSILESEVQAFRIELGDWWLRLYDATVRGPTAASRDPSSDDALGIYLDALTPLIEDFIVTCPIGQFDRRLDMIKSFASMTFCFASIEGSSREAMERTSHVLSSIHVYFEQFANKVFATFIEEKASIEKDIQGLIKLATWRDVNVYALQQSAQKTHKQLYRRIRKFRELLRQPVVGHLRVNDAPAAVSSLSSERLSSGLVDNFAKFAIGNAPPRAQKFTSVLSNSVRRISDSSSATDIEELSLTIISVQEEYAKSLPPVDVTSEQRKRWSSALLVRKKRAWNDLLKELKRIGLSPNIKPEILEKHRNRRRIFEHAPLKFFADTPLGPNLQKIDHYFYRTVTIMTDLLQCDRNHHSDIATRELQRGVSSFESAFSFAMSARSRISDLAEVRNTIRSFSRRLHEIKRPAGTYILASVDEEILKEVKLKLTETVDAANELLKVADDILELSEGTVSIRADDLDGTRHWLMESTSVIIRLSEIEQESKITGFITEDESKYIRTSQKHLESTDSLLAELGSRVPPLRRFCSSIRDWSRQRPIKTSSLSVAPVTSDPQIESRKLTDLLLVIGQDLDEVAGSLNNDDEDDSRHVVSKHALQLQVSRVLRTDRLLRQLQLFAGSLHGRPPAEISESVGQILPFLDNYIAFIEWYILEYLTWTKALLKLTYILGRLLLNIAQQGFCKSPEYEEADAAEGPVESAEGTGLGQGEGKEDISNQIEDESQFDGVKGQEDETDGQPREEGGDDALDVDFDLGGQLEDGPEQDALSEDDESISDLDDEFEKDDSGDLKPVDEEFWDKQPEEKPADGQEVDDSKANRGEVEIIAKGREERAGDGGSKEDADQGEESAKEENAIEKPESDLMDEQDSEIEEEETSAQKDAVDDAPKLEDTPGEPSQPEGQDKMVNDLEDLYIDGDFADAENQSQDGQSEEPGDGESQAGSKADEMEVEDGETGDQDGGEPVSNADVHPGNGTDGGVEMETDEMFGSSEHAPQIPDVTSADKPSSTAREMNSLVSAGDTSKAADASTERETQSKSNSVSHGINPGQELADVPQAQLPNPHRSLGDALREVRRHFDEIRDAIDADSHAVAENDAAKQTALEYAPDESPKVGMQALGPAMQEKSANLNRLNLLEEDEQMHDATIAEHPPMPRADAQGITDAVRQDLSKPNGNDRSGLAGEQLEGLGDQNMDVDNALQGPGEFPELSTVEEETSQSKKVEYELNRWRREGQPEEDGQRVWQLYDMLTQSLSFSLCEQLRLILEPTRATRLMGDFRTGKRLNMKKIIPYIASNYTKDKIWLRRVRPSQREYQVLIALDDSRSMAESHSIHLAFQTLALVSKALNRLEVGDVAIASFGERMQMLHGFEDGAFADQAGTKIVQAFKFAQIATDVRSLLESSLEALTKARERRASSSSSDLWQLEIVISDGICQDHEELRAIMRKAEEQRILIVFIVLDAQREGTTDGSSGSHNSIINMNQAMYRTVNGRLELHMQRYLDSFPFEFFVILKSMETLPDVLADTLRQFFERISAS